MGQLEQLDVKEFDFEGELTWEKLKKVATPLAWKFGYGVFDSNIDCLEEVISSPEWEYDQGMRFVRAANQMVAELKEIGDPDGVIAQIVRFRNYYYDPERQRPGLDLGSIIGHCVGVEKKVNEARSVDEKRLAVESTMRTLRDNLSALYKSTFATGDHPGGWNSFEERAAFLKQLDQLLTSEKREALLSEFKKYGGSDEQFLDLWLEWTQAIRTWNGKFDQDAPLPAGAKSEGRNTVDGRLASCGVSLGLEQFVAVAERDMRSVHAILRAIKAKLGVARYQLPFGSDEDLKGFVQGVFTKVGTFFDQYGFSLPDGLTVQLRSESDARTSLATYSYRGEYMSIPSFKGREYHWEVYGAALANITFHELTHAVQIASNGAELSVGQLETGATVVQWMSILLDDGRLELEELHGLVAYLGKTILGSIGSVAFHGEFDGFEMEKFKRRYRPLGVNDRDVVRTLRSIYASSIQITQYYIYWKLFEEYAYKEHNGDLEVAFQTFLTQGQLKVAMSELSSNLGQFDAPPLFWRALAEKWHLDVDL